MPTFQHRSYKAELLDDPSMSERDLRINLREIDYINSRLGGDRLTVEGVDGMLSNYSGSLHIADVGCGSGNMLLMLQQALESRGEQEVHYVGYDYNPTIVQIAKEHCSQAKRVRIVEADATKAEFERVQQGIAIMSLFLHHFNEEAIQAILSSVHQAGYTDVLINDLHRHPIAWYGIRLLTFLFSKSKLTRHDAALSVLRGFKRKEWIAILDACPFIASYSIQWVWAFRWKITIHFKLL